MEPHNEIYSAIAGLLDYPNADFRQRLVHCRKTLNEMSGFSPLSSMAREVNIPNEDGVDSLQRASALLGDFNAATHDKELHELEELYTRTFDFSPASALEIGWHLFGEDYNRGALLVRLRDELARHGIEESRELPDHLIHVLPLVERMSQGEAEKFSKACVLPAVETIITSLEKKDNPYESLLRCLALLLTAEFGRETQTTIALPVLGGAISSQFPGSYQ